MTAQRPHQQLPSRKLTYRLSCATWTERLYSPSTILIVTSKCISQLPQFLRINYELPVLAEYAKHCRPDFQYSGENLVLLVLVLDCVSISGLPSTIAPLALIVARQVQTRESIYPTNAIS